VINRDRNGHRLMVAYYVLAAVVITASCALQPSAAGIFIGAGFGIGIVLLIDVTIASRRALGPLRAGWPQLAKVPASGGTQRKATRGTPVQPHTGMGGFFYVVALLLLAAAGGIAMSAADAAAASATTQVTIESCNNAGHGQEELCSASWQADGRTYHGTVTWASEPGTEGGRYDPEHPGIVYSASTPYLNGFTVILGTFLVVLIPLCARLYRKYQRESRRPYLAALEEALSEAHGGGPPPALSYAEAVAGPGAAQATTGPQAEALPGAPPVRHRLRIGEKMWVGFMLLVVALTVLRLVLLLVGVVFLGAGSGTGGSGTASAESPSASPSATPSPYPAPAVAGGVVTDTRAGIRYAAPPGTGWAEDTNPAYPPEGAEFLKAVPGQSGDDAAIMSAPLPAGISVQGPNGLQDSAAEVASRISGTLYSDHTTTVLANHGFRACGQAAWLAEFRVHYTAKRLPDETGALAVVSLGAGRLPGVLFASIPDVMGTKLADQIVQSARPLSGC
jgi:hypothetical protein